MKAWLSNQRNGKWLMIIDNADDANVFFNEHTTIADPGGPEVTPLSKYIPDCSHGAILVTTRTKIVGQKLARGRCLIKVSPMNEGESVELFSKQFQVESLETNELGELTRELEGLPLALAQAAAFIQMNSLTVHAYLKLYKENDEMKIKLLSEHFEAPGRDSKVPNPVAATWMISFDHIKRTAPRAADILSRMALLDRQGIPESLIREKASDQMELAKALGVLKAFSLISANEAGDTFNMHRLVHLAICNWLRLSGEFEGWATSCLKKVSEEFPSGEYGTLDICDLYLPHAKAALSYRQLSLANDVSWALLAFRMSVYLQNRGSYNDAKMLAEQALGRFEKILGKEHPDTLNSMNNLAEVLDSQGKYKEAEEMHQRTLELQEKVLGKEHPETMTSMNNLSLALYRQSKYDEAEEMHQRTLELRERVLGKEHPHTLTSMDNLGLALYSQGKYGEAEEMHQRTLELRERVLGKEHPRTLQSMNNLAAALWARSKYDESEEMLRRTLELKEKVLGKEHPDTIIGIYWLAFILKSRKQYDDSSILYQRALSGYQEKLGSNHPTTLACSEHYSLLLEEMKLNDTGKDSGL
jgi:tetratricopeptide (TPR) repeat protein